MAGHAAQVDDNDPVAAGIARAHAILPDQGPIGVFIHHNTLHAFQHLPFFDGVEQGAALLGARPYLTLGEWRGLYATGRIQDSDVDAELALLPLGSESLRVGITRGQLRRILMLQDVEVDDEAGLAYSLQSGALSLALDEPLLAACRQRLDNSGHRQRRELEPAHRHRDVLAARGEDTDVIVHAEMIRMCAAFLDQGQARVAMPARQQGFLAAVAELYAAGCPAPRGCMHADEDFRRIHAGGPAARQVIDEALAALDVPAEEVSEFVLRTALALPGFAGMFSRLERHPDEQHGGPPSSLAEFLAVRLVLERRVVEQAALRLSVSHRWPELRRIDATASVRGLLQASLLLWSVAVAAQKSPVDVAALSDDVLAELWSEATSFSSLHRRRVWLTAYERRYRRQILDGLAARRRAGLAAEPAAPTLQVVFCIDEREESIRRAIEEQDAAVETFGVAGFFGVAIDYKGLDDHTPAAHCPVVVVPGHEVHEEPLAQAHAQHIFRRGLRDAWHGAERFIARASRTLWGGAGVSLLFGPLAGALATSRVVAPRFTLSLRESVKTSLAERPTTRLSALREVEQDYPSPRGKPVGFSLDEAADRVIATLKNLGLADRFAPLVVLLGHGSTSLNNPHESAHDCGACGGRRGGANARMFADVANRKEVRAAVAQRGVRIPDDVLFVGGMHDTANDHIELYDLDRLPESHRGHLEKAASVLDKACRDSAQERCRRFDNAPLGISPERALRHVEGRASHLSQPRPEYGHCTNAIAVVGRRSLTRGLHLDRRAFLISYDPTKDQEKDHEDAILERILAAVGPVGAGINLEYYFSSVDNEVFGCGTKLPHNVTGLIGIMSGHQSDLRTGLPLQMVELHEPMRLLLIVEATPESLLAVAGRQAEVRELVVQRWVQLVSVHPTTGNMAVFGDGGFSNYVPSGVELPVVQRSVQWHGRSREHLPPALVTAGLSTSLSTSLSKSLSASLPAVNEPAAAGRPDA